MVDKDKKIWVPIKPEAPLEEKRQYHRIDDSDSIPDVAYNSSLGVPPGKVVTESYKEDKQKK